MNVSLMLIIFGDFLFEPGLLFQNITVFTSFNLPHLPFN